MIRIVIKDNEPIYIDRDTVKYLNHKFSVDKRYGMMKDIEEFKEEHIHVNDTHAEVKIADRIFWDILNLIQTMNK